MKTIHNLIKIVICFYLPGYNSRHVTYSGIKNEYNDEDLLNAMRYVYTLFNDYKY